MKSIGLKDPFTPVTKVVDENTVEATRAFRPSDSDNSPRFVVSFALDYENVSREELLELATRSVVIDIQRNARVAYNSAETNKVGTTAEKVERTWSVREMLDAARPRTDPVSKLKAAVGKLSAEEKAALLKALQESNS